MPYPNFTMSELAQEIGRRPSWLSTNWRREVERGKLPPPIMGGGGSGDPPIWSRAHVYAYFDQNLPREMRIHAAAYRAAMEAAQASDASAIQIAADAAALDAQFAGV